MHQASFIAFDAIIGAIGEKRHGSEIEGVDSLLWLE